VLEYEAVMLTKFSELGQSTISNEHSTDMRHERLKSTGLKMWIATVKTVLPSLYEMPPHEHRDSINSVSQECTRNF
jgi:hypothetical protein